MKKYFLFVVVIFLMLPSSLQAQLNNWFNFGQSIDVQAYQNKKFRFSGAVKVISNDTSASVQLWARVDKQDRKTGFFDNMNDRSISARNWKTYLMEGFIDHGAENLVIGGLGPIMDAQFFFDDFRLEIEVNPGKWKRIQIKNAGFEKWPATDELQDWFGNIILSEIAAGYPVVVFSKGPAYKGNNALLVNSKIYRPRINQTSSIRRPNIKFEHITQEQGFPISNVTFLYQDKQGFIWIGTDAGLVRYDGYGFVVYQNDVFDSSSLSDNSVTVIFEDSSNKFWVGTKSGGLNLLNRETGQFEHFWNNVEDFISLSKSWVTAICEDHLGILWIGTKNGGLYRFDPNARTFRQEYDRMWRNNMAGIIDIIEDTNDVLWVVRESLEGFGDTRIVNHKRKINYYSRFSARTIYFAQSNIQWIGLLQGLHRLDLANEQFDWFAQSELGVSNHMHGKFWDIHESSPDVLWLSWGLHYNSIKGISRFVVSKREFEVFEHNSDNIYSLNEGINALFTDKEGVLWVGTVNGINRLNPLTSQFQKFHANQLYSLNSEEIIGPMLEDRQGAIWIATKEGLHFIDPKTGSSALYQHNSNDPGSLRGNLIGNLFEDYTGELWVEVDNFGIYRFDRETKKFFPLDVNGGAGLLYDKDIYEDRRYKVWLGTVGGLYQFERATKTFHLVPQKNALGKNHEHVDIRVIFEDQSGVLWLGMQNGTLKSYDSGKGFFHIYNPVPKDVDSNYSGNRITHICETREGELWIGTQNNGLRRFDPQTKTFTHFDEKDGLIHNSISSILEDSQGRLWISTKGGLSKFDPQTNYFRNYTEEDGLPSAILGKGFKSKRTGFFYFASEKGLVGFHPDSIRTNSYIPPIVFTSLRRYNGNEAEGKAIVVKGISQKKSITLSYLDDLLVFEFAALSYAKTAKNEYTYKMEGVHNEWISLGRKRELSFTNLRPGKYTLRVKGSNGDGLWNEEGASLKITITPPWYWAPLSKTIYALFVLGVLYWFYHSQLNRRLAAAETQRLRELDQVKTKLYTNITHEFRTPLTVIQGVNERMKKEGERLGSKKIAEDADVVKRNSAQLLHLVNQMLDLRKLESGNLPVRMVQGDVLIYLKYLLESFHSLAETKDIRLHFLSEEKELIMDYDPEKIRHIVSNLLSNAIKFTPEERDVYISVVSQPVVSCSRFSELKAGSVSQSSPINQHSSLVVKVKDTGIGISPEKLPHIFDRFYQVDDEATRKAEGTGVGLTLAKELVKLLKGEIQVESEIGEGTTFTVLLPIRREAEIMKKSPAFDQDKVLVLGAANIDSPTPELPVVIVSGDQLPLALIIEDNKDVANYIRSCLESGYRLEMARNGQEGINKAVELTPDLIVSDVMMPEKDGFKVTQSLKNDPRTSHIPIILLTAKADIASKLEGLERGADAYLPKPFNQEELRIRSRKLLELRRKLQQHYLSMAGGNKVGAVGDELSAEALEDAFVLKVRQVIQDHLTDFDFSVEQLARQVTMSRSQLHRKLTALTGYSPNRLIRYIRLSQAKSLLRDTDDTIAAVAYDCGFGDPQYFGRLFKKEFGMTPGKFRGG